MATRKSKSFYGREATKVRRAENRRRRRVAKTSLAKTPEAMPRFKGTQGYLTW